MATTIQLDKKTKADLEKLKVFPKETYDDVLRRLINIAKDDEPLSKQTISGIETALNDIKQGKTYSSRQVKRRLKL